MGELCLWTMSENNILLSLQDLIDAAFLPLLMNWTEHVKQLSAPFSMTVV